MGGAGREGQGAHEWVRSGTAVPEWRVYVGYLDRITRHADLKAADGDAERDGRRLHDLLGALVGRDQGGLHDRVLGRRCLGRRVCAIAAAGRPRCFGAGGLEGGETLPLGDRGGVRCDRPLQGRHDKVVQCQDDVHDEQDRDPADGEVDLHNLVGAAADGEADARSWDGLFDVGQLGGERLLLVVLFFLVRGVWR